MTENEEPEEEEISFELSQSERDQIRKILGLDVNPIT